jgi:cytochrome c oxidase cbb3-type subunit 2
MYKLATLCLLVTFAGVTTQSAFAEDAAEDAATLEQGAATYTKFCVACHQADGSGMNGMLAANLKKTPERLDKPDEELLASIRDGMRGSVGVMPPWKASLSEEEMASVLAYMRATYGKKAEAPE